MQICFTVIVKSLNPKICFCKLNLLVRHVACTGLKEWSCVAVTCHSRRNLPASTNNVNILWKLSRKGGFSSFLQRGKSIQKSLNNFFFFLRATLVPFYVTTKPTNSPGSCPRVRLSICSISWLRNLLWQARRGSCLGEVRLSCRNVHILSMVCQAERQNKNSLLWFLVWTGNGGNG